MAKLAILNFCRDLTENIKLPFLPKSSDSYSNLPYHSKDHCITVAKVYMALTRLPSHRWETDNDYSDWELYSRGVMAALYHDAKHPGDDDDAINVAYAVKEFQMANEQLIFESHDGEKAALEERAGSIRWLIETTQWPHQPIDVNTLTNAAHYNSTQLEALCNIAAHLRDADVLSSFLFYRDTEHLFKEFMIRNNVSYTSNTDLDEAYLNFVRTRNPSFLSKYTPQSYSGKALHNLLLEAWSNLESLSFREIGLAPITIANYNLWRVKMNRIELQ